MTATSLKINPQALVNNLRFGFTNATTVLGELMQNGRRAGATKVEFDFAPETKILQVRDDGSGIENIQTLLTVAESGWDADLIEREHPFGLGFLSALFACDHITVESKGGRFSAATSDLLAFKPVKVAPVDWKGVTTITLLGFKPDQERVKSGIRKLAEGYPIPVWFNGESLPRPAGLDCGSAFIETEVGQMCLQGFGQGEDWTQATERFEIYLQGHRVYRSHSFPDGLRHVVHLDSSRFFARLPDRDKLIDEELVVKQVREVLKREMRLAILEVKAKIGPEAFALGYETLARWGCLDLLNDLPVLPRMAIARIPHYPVKEGASNRNLECADRTITREEVESGRVRIIELDDFESAGAPRWMFAYRKGWLVYHRCLDQGHWLFEHLADFNLQPVQVEIVGETHRAYFDGAWVCGDAVFCESYRIQSGDDTVEIGGESMYDEEEGLFIVPGKDVSGLVVQQASSFTDEFDTLHESVRDEEEWSFHTFAVANTEPDAAKAMQKLLPSFSGCPALFGKQFVIRLDPAGKVESVEALTGGGAGEQ